MITEISTAILVTGSIPGTAKNQTDALRELRSGTKARKARVGQSPDYIIRYNYTTDQNCDAHRQIENGPFFGNIFNICGPCSLVAVKFRDVLCNDNGVVVSQGNSEVHQIKH